MSCTIPGRGSRFGLWAIVCQPHFRALTETGDLCLKNINRAFPQHTHLSFSSLQKSLGPGHSSFGFNIPFPFSRSPGGSLSVCCGLFLFVVVSKPHSRPTHPLSLTPEPLRSDLVLQCLSNQAKLDFLASFMFLSTRRHNCTIVPPYPEPPCLKHITYLTGCSKMLPFLPPSP